MRLFQTFLCLFVLAIGAAAQPVTGGLKIGVPLTDAITTAQNLSYPPASASDYEIGFYGEVRLPAKFALEVDALHRGYTFRSQTTSTSASSWEFPILLKYHLLNGPVRPFIDGGVSFSHLSDIQSLVVSQNHNTNFGIALGAGVAIHALVLHITPEIRYTGYALKNFDTVVDSNRNQVAFLVGIGF
ncbi:MAG TPA: outer membrane beta-barrel protein [Bryobacteraceae bacterium]|nr:outer membrane beta-barrel protein [Bryobacteraceae bacterium]